MERVALQACSQPAWITLVTPIAMTQREHSSDTPKLLHLQLQKALYHSLRHEAQSSAVKAKAS